MGEQHIADPSLSAQLRVLTERLERFRRVAGAARSFAERELALPELLEAVVREAAPLAGNFAFLALVSEDGSGIDGARGFAEDPRLQAELDELARLENRPALERSLLAMAVQKDESLVGWDLTNEAERAKLPTTALGLVERFAMSTFAVVPLRVRGVVIGALSIGTTGPRARPLEQDDVDALQSLADHAALALSNARLLAEQRKSRDRVSRTLVATGRFAEATSDYQALLDVVAQQAAELLGAYAAILLPVADAGGVTDDLEIVAEFASTWPRGAAKKTLLGVRLPRTATGVPGVRVFVEQTPLFLTDLRALLAAGALDARLTNVVTRLDINDFAGVPLRLRGVVIGALFVHTVPWTADHHLAQADLETLQMLADQAALAIANANLLGDVTRELAEHKRTREALDASEESLRQAQRMEAVGRLAGGIAHDFNNVLSVVLSYSDLLLESLPTADPMRADLEEIREAGQRAVDLTRQLLAFSRKQILAPRVIDLSAVVERTTRMLQRLLGADIELRFLPGTSLHQCYVDPGQLEQVLINLVVNARDAMPTGGSLTIETGNALLDEAYVLEHPEATVGPHVVLSVTDTGIGMDRATASRIFEPFFTTKPKEIGTGLGLATAYGIVKQSGGSIWVYSESGQGTTFKVYLPRASTGAMTSVIPVPLGALALSGSETILVVEDEPQVRTLVRGILSRAGYQVLYASHGGEALLLCEQHGARIHLLLTDVIMPRMSGRQLADRVLLLRPDVKVLFMSGYTENAIVNHGVLDSDLEFLPKPITPHALLAKVRAVLDGAG